MSTVDDVMRQKTSVQRVFDQKVAAGEKPRVRVSDLVNYKDGGISVEEARKRMLEAGQAPAQIASETKHNRAVGATQAPPPAAPAPAVVVEQPVLVNGEPVPQAQQIKINAAGDAEIQPLVTKQVTLPPAPAPVDNKAERVESDRYAIEIRQENGEWAAELMYKNGAGSEKFTARTKSELMLKLAEGKANATLRIRAAVRREKFGTSQFDQSYILPDDVTVEDFNAMSEGAQKAFIRNMEAAAGVLFVNSHPEFHRSNKNTEALLSFLQTRDLPITSRNLELAFEDLAEDGLLDVKPQVVPISVPSVTVPAPKVEDSTSVAPQPVPAPAAPAPVVAPAGGVVRKRGTTGLQPGDSSTSAELPEETTAPREPSVAELRKMSPIGKPVTGDLRAAYQADLASRRRQRQF